MAKFSPMKSSLATSDRNSLSLSSELLQVLFFFCFTVTHACHLSNQDAPQENKMWSGARGKKEKKKEIFSSILVITTVLTESYQDNSS